MDVSKNRGGIYPPKWMVKIMEKPIKMDDLGVFPYFWFNTHISISSGGLEKWPVFHLKQGCNLLTSDSLGLVIGTSIAGHADRHADGPTPHPWAQGFTKTYVKTMTRWNPELEHASKLWSSPKLFFASGCQAKLEKKQEQDTRQGRHICVRKGSWVLCESSSPCRYKSPLDSNVMVLQPGASGQNDESAFRRRKKKRISDGSTRVCSAYCRHFAVTTQWPHRETDKRASDNPVLLKKPYPLSPGSARCAPVESPLKTQWRGKEYVHKAEANRRSP